MANTDSEPPGVPARRHRVRRGASNELTAREQIERTLVKTVIALPLYGKIMEDLHRRKEYRGKKRPPSARLFDVIIDLHRDYPTGRAGAREWVLKTLNGLIRELRRKGQQIVSERGRNRVEQYVFARLTADVIRELVAWDGKGKQEFAKLAEHGGPRAIYQIWEDFRITPLIYKSGATMKCEAARASFAAGGDGIVWAVIDSGIQGTHPHFRQHANLQGQVEEWHCDFTGEGNPLEDNFGHGTHVAGILAGEIPPTADNAYSHPEIIAYSRLLQQDSALDDRDIVLQRQELRSIAGMAPRTKLVSLKVIDGKEQGSVSNVIVAIERVHEINGYGRHLRIHGVNLSVGYPFDPEWFACGQSQLCVEVNRLVRSGVAVVVAAGNTGYGAVATEFRGTRKSGLTLSINDPGNADGAITVGSTHRDMPHVYGVSYFSSKGPTGDGRLKPDLVAPGEKIVSCAAGSLQAKMKAKIEAIASEVVPNYIESTGTSMAAPHVSGAIAAFLSVKREFIGQPERVKDLLLSTCTDLRRERHFQGAGLIDLMRVIQSV